MRSTDRGLAGAAALLALCAAVGLGAALPGYSQLAHPLALPGAQGVPRALAFNLMVFVLPGALLATVAWRLRGRLPGDSGLTARLGSTLLLLAALAYATQGLLPLDPDAPDAGASRLHATAWTLWWIAFLAGTALLAAGGRALRPAAAAAWVMVFGLGVLAPGLLGAGISQRLAFAAWFGWMWWSAGLSRGGA
ncbi:DUF998 domain-containing protein [Luteimonas sp. M1R5S18]|uniref:DUF998 domain-containing protein n=1 Tax=Luteimonas rhizosphaericola TaxID=3042024 RepID=A0ABT6JNF1_9GAMM|nr:DUF998 domain-containing protein [Luteimonas rhizosphaericola]MDH5832047.1 DUF998 domain-containing protein [Luteimonas rhizosphaericola]